MLRGCAELQGPPRRAILTIGNFDGVHIGHRSILETVVGRARTLGGEAVVYTFDPHPRRILQPDRAPALLTTREQKLELLEAEGIDAVILEPFTTEFAKTPPEQFVRELVHQRLRPLEVYVGYDFHFGRDREGSMRLLSELGPRLGFAVTIIPEVTLEGQDVNSTRVRSLLREGRVEQARTLLGRAYAIRGRVVRGDQRGRTLGFPTANLDPENEILPALGVYAAEVRILEEGSLGIAPEHPAVANLGHRPTFGGEPRLVIEAHLLDYQGDLYGRRLEVAFRERLRDEQRFSGPGALGEQITRDVERARAVLASS